MGKSSADVPKRDESPVRKYHENFVNTTPPEIDHYKARALALLELIKSNESLLEKLNRHCLDLDSLYRDNPVPGTPLTLWWRTLNWAEMPEIARLRPKQDEVDSWTQLIPKFGLLKVEAMFKKQETLRSLMEDIYELYVANISLPSAHWFYPHEADVRFPFPKSDGHPTFRFPVRLIKDGAMEINDIGATAHSLISLVRSALHFATCLVRGKITKWTFSQEALDKMMGKLCLGYGWNLQNTIHIAPDGTKWRFGTGYAYVGDVKVTTESTYFRLPLSEDPEAHKEDKPEFVETLTSYPFKVLSNW
jgi:hypothetical protein